VSAPAGSRFAASAAHLRDDRTGPRRGPRTHSASRGCGPLFTSAGRARSGAVVRSAVPCLLGYARLSSRSSRCAAEGGSTVGAPSAPVGLLEDLGGARHSPCGRRSGLCWESRRGGGSNE
jgi:hypothetical protein